MRRVLLAIGGTIVALLVVAVVLLQTDVGARITTRVFLGYLNKRMDGAVTVGAVSGAIRHRLELRDVVVTGPQHDTLFATRGAVATYHIRDLLARRLVVQSLTLEGPVVTLERRDTEPLRTPGPESRGAEPTYLAVLPSVLLRQVEIRGGAVSVSVPRTGDNDPTESGPAGRSVSIADVDAMFPVVRVSSSDPGERGQLQIDELRFVVTDPDVGSVRIAGNLVLDRDTVALALSSIAVRGSRGRVEGWVRVGQDPWVDVVANIAHVAEADLATFAPSLPVDMTGRGTIRFHSIRPREFAIDGTDIELRAPQSGSVRGRFGITVADDGSWKHRDTRLTLTGARPDHVVGALDSLSLIGVLDGSITAQGPLDSLLLQADLEWNDASTQGASRASLLAQGSVAVRNRHGVTFHAVRVAEASVPIPTLRRFAANLPLVGVLTAGGIVTGTLKAPRFDGRIQHASPARPPSVIRGDVTIQSALGTPRFVADLVLDSLHPHSVSPFLRGVSLRTPLVGRVEARGRIDSVAVTAALEVANGSVTARGVVARSSDTLAARDLRVETRNLDVSVFDSVLPSTSLSGLATGRVVLGGGVPLEGIIDLRLRASAVGDNSIDSARLAARLDEDVVWVDTAIGWSPGLRFDGGGRLGVRAPQAGSIRFDFAADTSALLETLVARRIAGGRRDGPFRSGSIELSGSVDGSLEDYALEATVLGRYVGFRGTSADRVLVSGVWHSSERRFALEAQADSVLVPGLVGASVGVRLSGRPDSVDWHLRASTDSASLGGGGRLVSDSVSRTVALDSLRVASRRTTWSVAPAASVTLTSEGGIVARQFVITGAQGRGRLELSGALLPGGGGELDAMIDSFPLEDAFAFVAVDSASLSGWLNARLKAAGTPRSPVIDATAQVGDARFGALGVTRIAAGAQYRDQRLDGDVAVWDDTVRVVIADGELPVDLAVRPRAGRRVAGPFRVTTRVDGLPLAQALTLTGVDAGEAEGQISATATAQGTLEAPIIEGSAVVHDGRIGTFRAGRVAGTARYRDRRLAGGLEVWKDGSRMATAEGDVPIDLALRPAASRRLAGPIRLLARLDTVEVSTLASFLPGLQRPEGVLTAEVDVRGTVADPEFTGSVDLVNAAAGVAGLGVQYRNVNAALALSRDTVHVERLALESGGGTATVAGAILFEEVDRPVLDLRLAAENFRAMDLPDFLSVTVTGGASVRGPAAGPTVTVNGVANRGVLHFADLLAKQIVNLADPVFASFVDTSVLRRERLGGGISTHLLEAILIDSAQIDLGSDFWLRSSEANILLTGQVIGMKLGRQYRIDGTLNASRGTYRLQVAPGVSRDFTITGGRVRYFGTPDLNADLDINARHVVRTSGGERVTLFVHLGGTLYAPQLTLSSDVRPALSEAEIISYLVFGTSSVQAFAGEGGTRNRFLFQQSANQFTAALSQRLERSVANGLGLSLDYLQIRTGDVSRGFSDTEIAVGKQIRLFGRPAFLAASPRLCPRQGLVSARNVGAGLETWLGRRWLFTASAEPLRGCEAATTPTPSRYQVGFDLVWERRN